MQAARSQARGRSTTTQMKHTPKLKRSRLPSNARPAKSKPAHAAATAAHDALDRYLRAVNYLAAAQVYLQANPLLKKPLRPQHIRERLLGHWGTCPGINFIYAHLNRLIRKTDASGLVLTGPDAARARLPAKVRRLFGEFLLDAPANEVAEFKQRFVGDEVVDVQPFLAA